MDEGDEFIVEDFEKLPACANDDNFDLIRDRVGATRQFAGAYDSFGFCEDEEMMDTDSEEDSDDEDDLW